MGRIRGSAFYTRRVEDYKERDISQENFEQNMENIGSVIKVGTSLYKNPAIRDAIGGLQDLFQGDGSDSAAIAKAAAAEELKSQKENGTTEFYKAAQSRRAGAMVDFTEAQSMPDPVEELDIGVQTEISKRGMIDPPSSDEAGAPMIPNLQVSTKEGAERLLAHGTSLGDADPRKTLRLVTSMDEPTALRTLNEMQGRVTPGRGQFFYDLLFARTGFNTPNQAPDLEVPIPDMETRPGLPIGMYEGEPGFPLQEATTTPIPEPVEEAVVTEETVETPASMPSLISDEDFATSTVAEKNVMINQAQTRILTRWQASPQINEVINHIRAQVGAGGMGNTPAEVEETMERLAQTAQILIDQQASEGDMEVPNVAGKSLQEAQMVAMEIGQNPNMSFKAKQKAMRELLKQVKYIEDVTSDWAATGGTAGYVGTSAAANSLMTAFSGSIPKAPKVASEYQRSEMKRKQAEAPGKAENTRLKNLKLANQVVAQFTEGPIDADNKLLKNMISILKLDQLKTKKSGKGGGGGPSNAKLEEFREEIRAGADGSHRWLQSQGAKIRHTVNKLPELSVKEADTGGLSNLAIAQKYGADLSRYLQDVRNAETAQAKAAALAQAKKDIVRDLKADAKKFKAAEDKLSPMLGELRALGISEETRAKREVLLRKLNQLLQEIQGDI